MWVVAVFIVFALNLQETQLVSSYPNSEGKNSTDIPMKGNDPKEFEQFSLDFKKSVAEEQDTEAKNPSVHKIVNALLVSRKSRKEFLGNQTESEIGAQKFFNFLNLSTNNVLQFNAKVNMTQTNVSYTVNTLSSDISHQLQGLPGIPQNFKPIGSALPFGMNLGGDDWRD
ncbi:unnamed protein product [Allacma fusca]|uniref:Uncharacterized protein n=1 Tax=Allacma fusca TaxID=39272 RepID=A0A8J2K0W5_9HEXA|nr:unnamed protein product [Allacma fusca]